MIAVFTRYYPHRENFDEVLELAAALARDEKRQRVGCFETRLFCDREGGEIKSVSLWENKEIFDAYVDVIIADGSLMEFQSRYLRREIDTQSYDTVDMGVIGQLPHDTELQCRFGT